MNTDRIRKKERELATEKQMDTDKKEKRDAAIKPLTEKKRGEAATEELATDEYR